MHRTSNQQRQDTYDNQNTAPFVLEFLTH
uniref:Uncharacterized protein n=1 Tax=Rhizophora mucronata TaxID=61149 RepID=A0A2P2L8X7_RHIMU